MDNSVVWNCLSLQLHCNNIHMVDILIHFSLCIICASMSLGYMSVDFFSGNMCALKFFNSKIWTHSQLHDHIPLVPCGHTNLLFLNSYSYTKSFLHSAFSFSLLYFHSSKMTPIKDVFLVASNRKLNGTNLDKRGNLLTHVSKLWGGPQSSDFLGQPALRPELCQHSFCFWVSLFYCRATSFFESSLYSDTSPLLVTGFANIFSQSMACLSIINILQRAEVLNFKSNLLIFFFYELWFWWCS